jgi:hypothetical protein
MTLWNACWMAATFFVFGLGIGAKLGIKAGRDRFITRLMKTPRKSLLDLM